MNKPQLRALIEMLQKILDSKQGAAASGGTIVDCRPLQRPAPGATAGRSGPAPDDDDDDGFFGPVPP